MTDIENFELLFRRAPHLNNMEGERRNLSPRYSSFVNFVR